MIQNATTQFVTNISDDLIWVIYYSSYINIQLLTATNNLTNSISSDKNFPFLNTVFKRRTLEKKIMTNIVVWVENNI